MANRETQIGIEVIAVGSPKVRATQIGLQAVVVGSPKARLAQLGLEIIVPNVPDQAVPVGPLIPIMEMILP